MWEDDGNVSGTGFDLYILFSVLIGENPRVVGAFSLPGTLFLSKWKGYLSKTKRYSFNREKVYGTF